MVLLNIYIYLFFFASFSHVGYDTMKSALEGINSRVGDTEEHISDFEDRIMEITQTEQQKEKQILKNENSLRELLNNIKCTNINIIGVPEGEEG